jgi:xanthine dehydrogenase YagR molybdenum-binding subunit
MAPNQSLRTETYPSGIASVSVGEIERQVPFDEPPPLPANAELSVIGKPVPRINGRDKVTGAARFTFDVKLPGMLHARLLRSPHPHARIVSIETSAAERLVGVRAVHVITETVGGAVEVNPAPGGARALYVGAPIAAVAAATPAAAEAAVRAIKVEYEILPFVVDMEEARKADAPLVFQGPVKGEGFGGGGATGEGLSQQGNVRGPLKAGARGNVADGMAQAAVVAEGEFRTQVQTHCCMEPHGIVADWRADGLTVYMSTQ